MKKRPRDPVKKLPKRTNIAADSLNIVAKCPRACCSFFGLMTSDMMYNCRCVAVFHKCADGAYTESLNSPFICGLCERIEFWELIQLGIDSENSDLFTPQCKCGNALPSSLRHIDVVCDRCGLVVTLEDVT